MPSREIESALDLSGEWTGSYSYPAKRPRVAFSARLIDENGWVSGVTEEQGASPEARGFLLGATLQGRRDGDRVTWIKVYDKIWKHYYSVGYEGLITADGREISGTWSIPGSWSGDFVMTRRPGLAASLSREVSEAL